MPAAEIAIDEALVRSLVDSEHMPGLPLTHTDEGWDCSIWRLGTDLAVRIPRRALAAPLVVNEQRWLPGIAERLAPTGIAIPAPIVTGEPTADFPWPWSIVPWIDGMPGLAVPRAERAHWAASLAGALEALHTAAPADHPINPFRGVPLVERADAVAERLAMLEPAPGAARLAPLKRAWDEGVVAEPWTGPPVWIHGDLHPGNLIADGARLVGIIDFGDIAAGDPAYDLAVAWLAFDAPGRAAFIAACGTRVAPATWVRARAWAASVTLMLLAHSDDNPSYAALSMDCLAEFSDT